jgi:hypothetical protein
MLTPQQLSTVIVLLAALFVFIIEFGRSSNVLLAGGVALGEGSVSLAVLYVRARLGRRNK